MWNMNLVEEYTADILAAFIAGIRVLRRAVALNLIRSIRS